MKYVIIFNNEVVDCFEADKYPILNKSFKLLEVASFPEVGSIFCNEEFYPPSKHPRYEKWSVRGCKWIKITNYNEKIKSEMRILRNDLLSQTDWMLLPDNPKDTSEIRSYRQALRDIPQQSGFPKNIIWPDIPTDNKDIAM